MYTLFYSTKCNDSMNFLKIITTEGIVNMFNKIAIETIPRNNLINLGINLVPAVVIKENNQQGIYEGSKAFEWLNNIVQFRRQNMARAQNMQRLKAIQTQVMTEGIGHAPLETSGISDEFSYLTTDHAQPKSFMPYGHDERHKIVTLNNTGEGKITETEQKQRTNVYNQTRETQNAAIEQYLENQLKETIIKNMTQN